MNSQIQMLIAKSKLLKQQADARHNSQQKPSWDSLPEDKDQGHHKVLLLQM
jgi:hypothetical protein